MERCVRIIVTGKVQGVFYRQHTTEVARTLGLKGFVMNQEDGSVLIEAQGPPDKIDALQQWCHTGPPRAVVSGVKRVDLEDAIAFEGFVIRR